MIVIITVLTMCIPRATNSGAYAPFCIPFKADALEPPLMTGVNCCHVEFEFVGGWTVFAVTGVGCGCCDAIGGGELTGVDGFEL